jgi:hypothetical protein
MSIKSMGNLSLLLFVAACDLNISGDSPIEYEDKIKFVGLDTNLPINGVEVKAYKCVEYAGIICGSCSKEVIYLSVKSDSDGMVSFEHEANHTRVDFLHSNYSNQFYELELGPDALVHKLRPQEKIIVNLNGDSNTDSISSVSIEFCFYDQAGNERCPEYYGGDYYFVKGCFGAWYNYFDAHENFTFTIDGLVNHFIEAEITYYKTSVTMPFEVVDVVSSQRQWITRDSSPSTFDIDL